MPESVTREAPRGPPNFHAGSPVAGKVFGPEGAVTETVVPEPGMHYTVDDEEWEYHELSYILLNKPPGYECSQKPSAHPSVMDLLPSPFRER